MYDSISFQNEEYNSIVHLTNVFSIGVVIYLVSMTDVKILTFCFVFPYPPLLP